MVNSFAIFKLTENTPGFNVYFIVLKYLFVLLLSFYFLILFAICNYLRRNRKSSQPFFFLFVILLLQKFNNLLWQLNIHLTFISHYNTKTSCGKSTVCIKTRSTTISLAFEVCSNSPTCEDLSRTCICQLGHGVT